MKRLEMRRKHPLAIRWCHWVNFPLLALMIWSGLWIYWANDVYRVAFGVSQRLAQGMACHFFFMWFFALNGVLYVVYTIFWGEWRSLVPNHRSLREAVLVTLHDLGLWKGKLPERKFNGAQQIAYTGVILMGLGSIVTGLAIYNLPSWPG